MTESANDIQIRELAINDLAELGSLWDDSGLPHKPAGRDTLENLRIQWRGHPCGFIGAFDDSALIGAVLATDDGRRGWINRLAVLPRYRGQGIGKALIEAAEKTLKARGISIIAALIEEDNDASRAVFMKTGYELLPEILYYSKRESDNA